LHKDYAIDVTQVREDFPILKTKVNSHPLVYFDNASTSQKPNSVIDAVSDYYQRYNSNIHRGVHELSELATEAYLKAKEKIATFINAESIDEIVFTRGTTESINLVASSWGRSNIAKGDSIILTEMEHHSNIVPWQLLAKEKEGKLEYIGIDNDGVLIEQDLEECLKRSPKLVGVTQMSNVLGTINSVKEIITQAHKNGSKVLVDGAQSVPHMPVDVQELDCDFLAFSGHKMLGPTGIGILYAKREILELMPPYQGGGDMIKEVHLKESRWNDLPWKFEAGTSNISGAIGLGNAIDYLNNIGMYNIMNYEKEYMKYILDNISRIDDLTVYGPRDAELRGGIISFNIGDIHPHDLATILNNEGIAIRSGHHCAQPLMERLGIPATSRASFYIYNTINEADVFIKALDKAREVFNL